VVSMHRSYFQLLWPGLSNLPLTHPVRVKEHFSDKLVRSVGSGQESEDFFSKDYSLMVYEKILSIHFPRI
jgi:hypothetical protein